MNKNAARYVRPSFIYERVAVKKAKNAAIDPMAAIVVGTSVQDDLQNCNYHKYHHRLGRLRLAIALGRQGFGSDAARTMKKCA